MALRQPRGGRVLAIRPVDAGIMALGAKGTGVDDDGTGEGIDAGGFVDVAAENQRRQTALNEVGDGLAADGAAVANAVGAGLARRWETRMSRGPELEWLAASRAAMSASPHS